MLKKLIVVVAIFMLILVGCSSKSSRETNYDKEFINSLAKGLDKRWEDADKYPDESAKNYKLYLDDELNEVKEYKDKKFKDDKLKELAIRYINVLNEGKEVASNFGADAFEDQWYEHQSKREELLLEINGMYEIPVKDKDTLGEILASGREVRESNKTREKIESLIDSKEFEIDTESSSQFATNYFTIVENTTGIDIESLEIEVSLFDEEEVLYNTTYIYVNNWKNGTKARLEFTDFDNKNGTYELSLKYLKTK